MDVRVIGSPRNVNFTYDPFEVDDETTVQFYDISEGVIMKWHWKFDDGSYSYSYDKNPSYTFTSDGDYNIYLGVTDTNEVYDSYVRALSIRKYEIQNPMVLDEYIGPGKVKNNSIISSYEFEENVWVVNQFDTDVTLLLPRKVRAAQFHINSFASSCIDSNGNMYVMEYDTKYTNQTEYGHDYVVEMRLTKVNPELKTFRIAEETITRSYSYDEEPPALRHPLIETVDGDKIYYSFYNWAHLKNSEHQDVSPNKPILLFDVVSTINFYMGKLKEEDGSFTYKLIKNDDTLSIENLDSATKYIANNDRILMFEKLQMTVFDSDLKVLKTVPFNTGSYLGYCFFGSDHFVAVGADASSGFHTFNFDGEKVNSVKIDSRVGTFKHASVTLDGNLLLSGEVYSNAKYKPWVIEYDANGVITSVDDGYSASLKSELTIFPNPTTGMVYFDHYKLPVSKIEIYDLLGNKVASLKEGAGSYDCSALSTGIYFVVLKSNSGIYSEKMIVR